MNHPLKITSTLADKTRFHIYEHMLKSKSHFTVQQIADQFHIHPNVARFHLTKLADIGVISAVLKKTGKGGRPGRMYHATNGGVQLSFPKRDDAILVKILLPLIDTLGEDIKQQGLDIAYNVGCQTMKECLPPGAQLTFEERCDILSQQAMLIGYIPKIIATDTHKEIHFTIYNCPFQNQIEQHHTLVCALHEAFIRGQIDTLFGPNTFKQVAHLLHNCENCLYKIEI